MKKDMKKPAIREMSRSLVMFDPSEIMPDSVGIVAYYNGVLYCGDDEENVRTWLAGEKIGTLDLSQWIEMHPDVPDSEAKQKKQAHLFVDALADLLHRAVDRSTK